MKICIFLLLFIMNHSLFAQRLITGTYTDDSPSKGIHVFDFDAVTGKAKEVGYASAGNPTYLTMSKNGKFIYNLSSV